MSLTCDALSAVSEDALYSQGSRNLIWSYNVQKLFLPNIQPSWWADKNILNFSETQIELKVSMNFESL